MAIIGNIIVNLIAKTKKFSKGMKMVSKKLMAFKFIAKGMVKAGMFIATGLLSMVKGVIGFVANIFKKAFRLIKKLTKIAILSITALFTISSVKAAQFGKTMSRVKAITNATEGEFMRLRLTAEHLGATTEHTAKQAAEAMSFLALAGFKTTEIVEAMPSVLNLASAGQLEMASAGDIAARVMRGMGIEAKDLHGAIDVLAKAFTSSNTDLEMLGEAFKFVGPVARVLNKSIEETTASLMVLSNSGIQSTMAGTALRGVFARLSGAVPAVAKEIKQMGIVTTDASGAMLNIANIVGQFEKKFKGMGEAEQAARIMRLFGLRAGPGMAVLIKEGSAALSDYQVMLEGSAGTASKIAKTQLDNLAGSWVKLKSIIVGVAISIGQMVNPTIRASMDGIRKWLVANKGSIVFWAAVLFEKIKMVGSVIMNFMAFMVGDFPKAMKYGFQVALEFAIVFGKALVNIMRQAGRELWTSIFGGDAGRSEWQRIRIQFERNMKEAAGIVKDSVPPELATRFSSTMESHDSGMSQITEKTGRSTEHLNQQMLWELTNIKEAIRNQVGSVS